MFIDENSKVENRFKTIENIKTALRKKEISFEGAWENLCRFFGMKPFDANKLIESWEKETASF